MALGPSATEWRDALGSCGAIDTMTQAPAWAPVRLNAVHGRSRPNGGVVVTNKDIWAVGDAGNIIYFDGTKWVQQAAPAAMDPLTALRAVFIYQSNVTVGADQVAGWAAGDHGTVLRLTENTPGSYVWKCENCPVDCGPPPTVTTGGGGFNLCATVYDIFPSDSNDVNAPVFFTGEAQCRWYPDGSCQAPFGDAMTLFFFKPGMAGWQEAWGNSACASAPYYIADASWINAYNCTNGVTFTGVISQATAGMGTAGGALDSGYLRFSTGLTGNQWAPFPARFTTSGCAYEPAYYTSAMFGKWAVVMGDAAGVCWNHSSPSGAAVNATNMFVYNQFSGGNPVYALRSGLSAAMDATWGCVRKLASVPAWGYGIGVGHGAAGGADVGMDRTGVAPNAYFALVKWTDTNRLVQPEDPTSPNSVLYEQQPGCASGNWPGLNGVFISAYNEAWAVGEGGKIMHWAGPTVQPAKLECALSLSPSGAIPPGTLFDVVLTVTNTGEAGLANLLKDLVITPPSSAGLVCGPFCSTIWCDFTSPCPVSLPPSGPAYFTWTFSMTGCGTGISFTASVSGLDLFGNGNVWTSTQYIIGSEPLTLTVTTWHTPAAVTAGIPVTFAIVVSNATSATANNAVIVDTLSPLLQGVVLDGPPGFTPVVAGAIVSWEATGPTTIPPGVSFTFSATGQFSATCTASSISNVGFARADDGCGNIVGKASGADAFTIPGLAAPALTVTIWHVPASPSPGTIVAYTIQVLNTGTATITSLTVVETLPPELADPVAWPASLGVTPGWAGTTTIFTWNGPISLLPGTSAAFSVSAYVPSTCVSANVTNRGWALGRTTCSSSPISSSFDTFVVAPLALPALDVTVSHLPDPVVAGDQIVYTIDVRNTGAATITNLLLVDTMPAGLLAPTEGFTPAPFTFSATGRVFSWQGTGFTLFPTNTISFTASGFVPSGCSGASMANLAWSRVVTACGTGQTIQAVSGVDSVPIPGQIAGAIAVESQQEVPGRYFLTVTLTITDTGSSWINRIMPATDLVITPSGPETVKVSGPSPTAYLDALAPIPGTSVNPCQVSFRWNYRSTTVTPITITALATGEICPAPISFSDSSSGCAAQAGGTTCTFSASTVTFFNDSGNPGDYALNRNLFRGRTETLTVTFTLPETTDVSLIVYNSVGQKVKTLMKRVVARRMAQMLEWDGTNDDGERCASGAYFVRLETAHWVKTKKVALVK
ncbi:MAG: FlgD immunoglobulin-like domain containing protein [Candidatus Coatesbacteria bacterium]